MFNRKLEVKMVKNDKKVADPSVNSDIPFERKAAIVGRAFEKVVEKAGGVLVTYILLDTIRQVYIAKAKNDNHC